ncbi:MAG: amylo-alpha-1,6-glucosidase [Deferribacteraceae bacterium]|nr:amylo-alpha-1,6-glucosidase [Deferribacteraceae bacterium]
MKFCFDKLASQNIRKSLREEWLETNGLGDYASSSLVNCNTRKYHGLLVTGFGAVENRHVLLSTIEESFTVYQKELFFSCHRYPGNRYFPPGYEYLREMSQDLWPFFRYKFGDIVITKEIMMITGESRVVIKYEMKSAPPDTPQAKLRLRPLVAFRHFHSLIRRNDELDAQADPAGKGFVIKPYDHLPPLYAEVQGDYKFTPEQAWFYNVEYLLEQERGFEYQEDLFQPGVFEIELKAEKPIFFTAALEEYALAHPQHKAHISKLWDAEAKLRQERAKAAGKGFIGHLSYISKQFLVRQADGNLAIIAGYPWFNIWGRDMYISLPGLTFSTGDLESGLEILRFAAKAIKGGVVPNIFAADGASHAYNSADASLWYIWSVQQLLKYYPDQINVVKKEFWPKIKEIIKAYASGSVEHTGVDEAGLLRVGAPNTQLTWMDATVNGRAVTPRNGFPVEINALWYNALAFSDQLAVEFKDTKWRHAGQLEIMKKEFFRRFWVTDSLGGYLADVWSSDHVDTTFRPNQIFAVSLEYAILPEEHHTELVKRVRHHLFTNVGLRTLAPGSQGYAAEYSGGVEKRDGAYHQGTVWPWLLGAFTEGLLRTASNSNTTVFKLLDSLKPLFVDHLKQAGIGTISEVFDGDPPHIPGGAISQAWSVAECLRMLTLMKEASNDIYTAWESEIYGDIR